MCGKMAVHNCKPAPKTRPPFAHPLLIVKSREPKRTSEIPTFPETGIRTFDFGSPLILLHQTECPSHPAAGNHACQELRDGTLLYCRARIEAARLRTGGGTWTHRCAGGLPLVTMRLILPLGAACFNCGAEYVRVPGEGYEGFLPEDRGAPG